MDLDWDSCVGPALKRLTAHLQADNYYFYTADNAWVNTIWTNYTRAVAFLEQKVDYANTGLMNVTGLRDWARLGGGGFNSEGNALLYKVGPMANGVNKSHSL